MMELLKLLEPETCAAFLDHQQQRIKAPNRKVAASMVIKRYAKESCDHILPSMLWENKVKVVPLDAVSISRELTVNIDDSKVFYVDTHEEGWKHLFANHLTRVLMAMHVTTNLPMIILWENVAVRINSYFKKAVQNHPEYETEIRTLFAELHELEGRLFNQDAHPMKSYLSPVIAITEQHTRKTCCYYHKLDKEKELSHCLVCPLK